MAKAGKGKLATSYTEEVAAGSSTSRKVVVALVVVSGAVLVAAVLFRATELQRENAELRKEQSALDVRLASAEKLLVVSKGQLSDKEQEGVAQKAELDEVRKDLAAKEREVKDIEEVLGKLKEDVLQQESVNSLVTEENGVLSKVIEENEKKIAEMSSLVQSKEQAHTASLEKATKERERIVEELKKENQEKVLEISKNLDATVKSLELVKSLKEQTETELSSVRSSLLESEQRCKGEVEASQEKLEEVVTNCAREKATFVESAKVERTCGKRERCRNHRSS